MWLLAGYPNIRYIQTFCVDHKQHLIEEFIYDGMMCFLLFGLDLRMLREHTIYLYKKKSSFAYVNAGFQERTNQHDE